MREYDQRFVYPKVFAMTSDKGVMTHEGMLQLAAKLTVQPKSSGNPHSLS